MSATLLRCAQCQCDFPYKGAGRPAKRCDDCRTGLVKVAGPAVMVKNQEVKIKAPAAKVKAPTFQPQAFKPKGVMYDNDPKRDNQRRIRQALLAARGETRIPGYEGYGYLCDRITSNESQYHHMIREGFVDAHQIVGFCIDPDDILVGAQKVQDNINSYPDSTFIPADVGSKYGISQLSRNNVKTFDFDPCESVRSVWVRKTVAALFASDLEWITLNACAYNYRWGGKDYSMDFDVHRELLETIDGFENWELIGSDLLNGYWFDDYHSRGRGGGQIYRTVILHRKDAKVKASVKEVKAEAPKERTRETGTIVRAIPERGFGFIRPDDGGQDIFVHASRCGVALEVGKRVSFYKKATSKGFEATGVIAL